jgi:hypothetical protein
MGAAARGALASFAARSLCTCACSSCLVGFSAWRGRSLMVLGGAVPVGWGSGGSPAPPHRERRVLLQLHVRAQPLRPGKAVSRQACPRGRAHPLPKGRKKKVELPLGLSRRVLSAVRCFA